MLRSLNPLGGAFLVSMQYSGFTANNNQSPGEGKSSAMELRLGDETKTAFIIEGKNSGGKFIQAEYDDGVNPIYRGNYILTNSTSGWLGLEYNGVLGPGGQVAFLYDFGAGWQLLQSMSIDFSTIPYFSIMGENDYGLSLSFQINQVQLIALPPSLLLLGTGLLSLAGWGRKLRKS